MKLIRKTEPFIENVVIGLLFVGLGFHIVNNFNDNFFGFVGFISIFWGCFKILIGSIIYGITIWAMIYRPESFIHVQRKRILERILKRAAKDIEFGNLQKAKDRLHGLISKYPNFLEIRFELSNIYLRENDLKNAGRYLYFKPNPNKQECLYINHFENCLGNSAFQILRRISIPSKIDIESVRVSKRKISELVEKVQIESERRSWIVNEYTRYLKELNAPFYKKLLRRQKDILINTIILVILFSLTELLKG